MELYVSNNECAQPTLSANERCAARVHPHFSKAEAVLMREEGKYRYNQGRRAAAAEWIRRNPERFLRLTVERFFTFWFPEPAFGGYAIATWLVTALSVAGIVLARRMPAAWFLTAGTLAYSCVYCLVQTSPRYRYPVLWVSLLAAGYCCARVLRRLRAKEAAAAP